MSEQINKYPANHGKVWTDKETSQLLISIQEKKSITLIANEHKRTVGGINERKKQLAFNYWLDKKTIDDIIILTGLTKEDIEDTIKRRSAKIEAKIKEKNIISNETVISRIEPVKKKFVIKKESDNIKEIIELLKDIQSKLSILIEKVS